MDTGGINLTQIIDERPFGALQMRVAVLCAFIAVLDGIDSQSIAIAAPSLAASFGMTVKAFGPVFSISVLGGVIGAIVCGSLSDLVGRKKVLIGATLMFAVFTILTAFSESYGMLLGMRFLAGLGLGGAIPCFLALSTEYAPSRRRGTLASLLWAAYPLGGMLGGFFNAYLVAHFGWPAMFYVGGVLPILVAIAMMVVLPESPTFLAARASSSDQLRGIAERIAGHAFERGARFFTIERKVEGLPVRHLLTGNRAQATLLLWVAFFASFGLLGLAVFWTPTILLGAGIPVASTAVALGFHNLGAVFGMGSAGRLVDRFGPRRTLVPAFVLAALFVWLLGSVGTLTEASFVLAMIGLFLGCGAGGLIALAAVVYPTTMRSTGIGWGMGMGRLGQVIGPLVTGGLMVGGMAPGLVMEYLAILPIIAGAAILLLRAFPVLGIGVAGLGGNDAAREHPAIAG